MMKYRILNIKSLTEADFENAFKQMSKERQEKCLRYKFTDDRRRMAFGESLLRKLISDEYAVREIDITIKNLPSGKPVAEVQGKNLCVSITHSGDYVACGVSDTPIGVDLEVVRQVSNLLLNKALNDEEKYFVNNSDGKNLAFLKLWTAKEAYLKFTGEGLGGLKKACVLPLVQMKEYKNLVLEECLTEDYVFTAIYER